MRAADLAAASIRDAGFVDVAEKEVKMPLGKWPKDKELKALGFCNRHHLKGGLGVWGRGPCICSLGSCAGGC